MAKRRVNSGSDDENSPSQSETPASKRAKTHQNGVQPSSSKDKGKNKATDIEIEIGDGEHQSDVEEETPVNKVTQEDQEADEEKFEQEHGDKIRQSLDAKRQTQGGVAEHGIIESVELNQFMCHKLLTFQFGPQINFIIGKTFCGKSAVLSAIAVALGGKANSTGRGSGIKSFIKEGQSCAEVTISIKNQGDEAYKPKEYGKSIVITRRFTKDGQTSWKIKSKDNRVVSTKREELAAICDHMNIQVDNPLNILTQDAARQFLSASHPSDKYKFFLKGTQLQQLSEEYDLCYEHINQTAKVLARKREAIPDLRSSLREATARYEEANRAREQKKRADELTKELAWAHVKTKEQEVVQKEEDLAKLNHKLPKIEKELLDARAAFEVVTDEIAKLEQDFRALGNMNDMNEQKQDLQKAMRENKVRRQQLNSDLQQMDISMKQLENQVLGYEKQIQEEALRMEKHTHAKREEAQRSLEQARQAVAAADSLKDQLGTERRELEQANLTLSNSFREDDMRVNELRDSVQRCQSIIEQCKQNDNDKYVAYGKHIKVLLDKIKTMRWHGEPPLGPLGIHVNAKEPEKWGNVLRYHLAQFLTAFAVTDARDRPVLKKMLNDSGNQNTLIVIYERDMFDFSRGELPEHVLTVHRALRVTDDYVLRILVNLAQIERIALAQTRREGDHTLRELRGGQAWTSDGFLVRVFPEGGVSSTKLDNMARGNALLLTGRDTDAEIQHHTMEMRRFEEELVAATSALSQKKKEWNDRKAQIDELQKRHRAAEDALRKAKNELNRLQQDANEALPANLAALEAAKQEAKQEQESIRAQFQAAMAQKATLEEENSKLTEQFNSIKKHLDGFHHQQSDIKSQIETLAEKRQIQKNNSDHFQNKLNEDMRKVEIAEQAAKVVQEEFTNWRQQALEICEPVENPRSVEVVQRQLESVKNALKEREKRHGASVEDMVVEVNRAKAKLDAVEKELKQMSALNKALKKSLTMRLARWQEFRRHIALRTKLVFQYNLSHRGYFGKILFHHENQTLQLKVQTDDQIATQGTRDKDPRSLSGGEKSFSTICLLLSLWESIGCPLRCLDEFDVFMDPINRRVSMAMMIDSAKGSDKKQYILITPQDMTSITPSNTVRVHRMPDPDRNQGVLRFGS
ncbi:hypothetical protein M378DRAFT_85587 [Amanita muscaria Koide BX008]|uniref:RecF/RecN/SMC N-terminal domain-containing protein n=1 Tax=Amanita muscaria (strain Koide BX008) TaxID=946122 RepID=A0A0C2S8H5_AMAMK|nr:hypothetical protein M378DRAFT_85587 [Amanita muscaria Koide BX008]